MWEMFVNNLNSTLLPFCLQNFRLLARWRLYRVLDFINGYSLTLFEPKGFKLGLWLIEVCVSLNHSITLDKPI